MTIIDQADALVACGAERAAEDARRAAAGVGVHSGDIAPRCAAADRSIALRAAAFRPAERRPMSPRCSSAPRAIRTPRRLTAAAASDGSVQRALELRGRTTSPTREATPKSCSRVAGRDVTHPPRAGQGSAERRRLGRVRARAPRGAASGAVVAVARCRAAGRAAPMRGCWRTSIAAPRSMHWRGRWARSASSVLHGSRRARTTRSIATSSPKVVADWVAVQCSLSRQLRPLVTSP